MSRVRLMKLVTAAQMRQLDQQTIEEIGVPSIVLMENAGRTTYQILRQEFPDLDGPVVVLAGRGNNGGDGFVVARYLANAGFEVMVLLLAEKSQIGGDARINLGILDQLTVPVREIITEEDLLDQIPLLEDASLLVDAIFGTGLSSEVKGLYRTAISILNDTPAPVLAIDIPSGLSADTGHPLGVAVLADVTVTYGWPKIGQIFPPGRDLVGRLWQVDISIPPNLAEISRLELAEPADLRLLLP
ncbi:MAG: NAD(P)H-hydrate epimerase, partial [Deltaproteobacteria bacterium]|nr:NAD(P)H-hydrate epimerase [Deltaproteobacteria bacterium]